MLTFLLSAGLLLNGGEFLRVFAQQSANDSIVERAGQSDDAASQSASRPRRIDADRAYDDDGPLIRVALMTDVTDVTLSSSSGFIVLRNGARRDAEKIARQAVRFEIRQQLVRQPATAAPSDDRRSTHDINEASRDDYRVEVGTVTDARQARKVVDDLKQRFAEPASIVYDKQQLAFHIVIGKFDDRRDALTMIERLRREGYVAAHIAPDYAADAVEGTNKSSVAKTTTNKTTATHREAEPAYQRVSQLVAVEGDHMLASSDDRLTITAANTAEPPRPLADTRTEARKEKEPSRRDSDYLETQQRDAERLWGARPKPLNNDAPSVVINPALGGTSSVRAASFLRVGGKEYRGDMQLILNARGRINVVNVLPLEQYLRGVVPMELSPGAYPAVEALKAQAVAARTYALAHRTQSRDADFDLRDDTRSQVYGGLSAERDLTNRAVEETRGVAILYTNDAGRLVPIDALYTANCGGRTENNEVIFGGKPLSYLRSVTCQPDRQTFAGHDIVSNRTAESLIESESRAGARDLALLQVLGFGLPRKASMNYLRGAPDDGEMQNWMRRAAEMAGHDAPRSLKETTRLGGFALLLASAIYGEGHARLLLTPADVDYLLTGLAVKEATPDMRASLALLLRDRILQWPAGFDSRAALTRGLVIETLARALLLKSRAMQNGNLLSLTASLKFETTRAAEQGRLLLALPTATRAPAAAVASMKTTPSKETRASAPPQTTARSNAKPKAVGSPHKISSKALASAKPRPPASTTTARSSSQPGTLARSDAEARPTRAGQEMTAKEIIAYSNATGFDRDNSINRLAARQTLDGLEVEPGAYLFRSFGDAGYAVDRLTLVGGESVIYHIDSTGRVDFLEATPSERGASSDRFSSVAQWQERISAEEVQRRLARVGVNVGPLDSITPTEFTESSRVIEIEVAGLEGTTSLRGPQLRSVLGLKENLFVVDREFDARGRVTAFVFTGRGWGHGVGMCQVGAYGLARDGYSYTQILQKYYTGVRVQKVY
ncbi:MAG: SpoIID/LytB domain-containing protein [Blastocatellia bacterium]